MSNTVARINVSASRPTIDSRSAHPQPKRGGGEEQGEEGMSGGPMFAEPVSPGSRKAIEMRSNRPASPDDAARRPAPDRERVDPRDDDGDQHHRRRLERLDEGNPIEVRARSFATLNSEPIRRGRRSRRGDEDHREHGHARRRDGRTRRGTKRDGGTTNVVIRTSGQRPTFGSTPAQASQAMSAARTAARPAARRRLSRAVAAPTMAQEP